VVSAIGLRWNWTALAQLMAVIVLVELAWGRGASLIAQVEPLDSDGAAPPRFRTALPYARPHSPAHRVSDWAARALRGWRHFWRAEGGTLALLFAAGLLMNIGLGAPAMWPGMFGLAAAALWGFWLRKAPVAAAIWGSVFFAAFAWIMGTLAVGGGWSLRMGVALAFGLAAGGLAALRQGQGWGRILVCAGLTAPAIVFIAERLALPAVAVLFLAAPAFALAAGKSREGFIRAVWPLLLINMTVVALSLGG